MSLHYAYLGGIENFNKINPCSKYSKIELAAEPKNKNCGNLPSK
jgi:hypothetical protein